ncbi:MAG: hypothetical protein ABI824_11380, partial [Acidobacteriota bacterium]
KWSSTNTAAERLAEEVTREFQTEIAALDWKQLLWRADDEPEGLKPLDLDEDESDEAPAESPDKPKRGLKATIRV